ncbi:hypothetical protein FOL47_007535 [Perkinsus chesapeaki]|uniref:Uncharacterized protein n=1 Tax=Perkinsus chesapeaki TaxID=330153 RepID=A0A7J6MVP2_PERCH|nr:hypothetical protein FOL47_007535 [Perkinsus chesapeaki]
MALHLYVVSCTFAILTFGQSIIYRDYKRGDKFVDDAVENLFQSLCQNLQDVPCRVAVDQAQKPEVVVGFLSMMIPYTLSKCDENAVRNHMQDREKEGIFAYLRYGRSKRTVLALTLRVDTQLSPVELYERLGFEKVSGGDYDALVAVCYY